MLILDVEFFFSGTTLCCPCYICMGVFQLVIASIYQRGLTLRLIRLAPSPMDE
jgi:hypothetical protein